MNIIKSYKLFETKISDPRYLGIKLINAAWLYGGDEVKKWIKKGADINFQDDTGFTPLMRCVNNQNDSKGFNNAFHLIKLGANLELKNTWGTNALMLAIANGKLNLFKLLINNGADLFATDSDGRDILYKSKTSYLNIIDWLKSYEGQKLILSKEPSLYNSFIKAGYEINPQILSEMPHLSTANDLNLI